MLCVNKRKENDFQIHISYVEPDDGQGKEREKLNAVRIF